MRELARRNAACLREFVPLFVKNLNKPFWLYLEKTRALRLCSPTQPKAAGRGQRAKSSPKVRGAAKKLSFSVKQPRAAKRPLRGCARKGRFVLPHPAQGEPP